MRRLLTRADRFLGRMLKKRPGVSLVIAMFMVLVFMLQMASIASQLKNSLEIHKGYDRIQQGYWNARSGIELGLLSITNPKAFQEIVNAKKLKIIEPDTNSKTKEYAAEFPSTDGLKSGVTWKIQNQSEEVKNTFGTSGFDASGFSIFPFPGTGNLGGSSCDIEQWAEEGMQKTGTDAFNKSLAAALGVKYDPQNNTANPSVDSFFDHPCLWNTLSIGGSAEIPLYFKSVDCPTDFKGDEVCNPLDVGMKEVILKVRTPCKDGKNICKAGDRYKLKDFGSLSENFDVKKVVIWDIVSSCEKNGKPDNCFFTGMGTVSLNTKKQVIDNPEVSVITGFLLNNTNPAFKTIFGPLNPFHVLNFDKKNPDDLLPPSNGPSGSILKALLTQSPWNTLFQKITKPRLRLSIADFLKDTDGKTIPNLEYQLLYKVDAAKLKNFNVSSFLSDAIVTAEGYHGSFHMKLQTSLSKPAGTFQYVAIPQD